MSKVGIREKKVLLIELMKKQSISVETTALAVAVNRQIIPREHWSKTYILPEDKVEIITPFEGG